MMDRRSFLQRTPAVGLSALIMGSSYPVAAALTDDAHDTVTPIMALFPRWHSMYCGDNSALNDDEHSLLIEQCHVISRRIEAEPCQSLKDLAAKVVASSRDGMFDLDDIVIEECRQLAGIYNRLPALPVVPDTPVKVAFDQWSKLRADWVVAVQGDLSESEDKAWCNRVCAAADDVLDAPSSGPMDFAYKLFAQSFDGEHDIGHCPRGEELWAELRAIVGVTL